MSVLNSYISRSNDVREQLQHLQDVLVRLQTERDEIRGAESRRDLMSKQLAIVGEVQQLGSAMHSHPLNSASARYAMVKRIRIEHARLEGLLQQRASDAQASLQRYGEAVQQITDADWLAQRRADIDVEVAAAALGGLVPFSEYKCVRELLEQSAQSAMYEQSEQLRVELDASYAQQVACVRKCVDVLAGYAKFARQQPIETVLSTHRLRYYADSCAQLLARPSVDTCREVVAQLQTQFGANGSANAAHVVQVANELRRVWCEDHAQLDALTERLHANLADASDPTSATGTERRASMERLLNEQLHRDTLMPCTAGMQALSGFNRRLLVLESAALTAGDALVDMRTSEGQWFLDELSVMATVGIRMTELLVPASDETADTADAATMRCVRATGTVYESLRALQQGFIGSLMTDTLDGICMENESILAMIARTSSVQEGIAPVEELVAMLQRKLRGDAESELGTVAEENVRTLKTRLAALARCALQEETVDVGFSLFMRYWRLFGVFEARQLELEATIDKIEMPPAWKGLDQVKEAAEMAVCLFVALYIFMNRIL